MILYGMDEALCVWASRHLFNEDDAFDNRCKALGILQDDEIIASVVYSHYQPNLSIEMSIASVDKRWANRHNLRAFFQYPFIQLGLERVTTLCSANDEGVIMFNKRLGFQQEGLHRKAWPMGSDAMSFGMLKSECKWIK